MTLFDQQLLANVFLSETSALRETVAVKAMTSIATVVVLLAGTALLSVAAADRIAPEVPAGSPAAVTAHGTPDEYWAALAVSEAADAEEAAQQSEASAR